MARSLTLAVLAALVVAGAAPAGAAVGGLSFFSCESGPGSVTAPCTTAPDMSGPSDVADIGRSIDMAQSSGNVFLGLDRGSLGAVACSGNSSLAGCALPNTGSPIPAGAFDDPEGVAEVSPFGARYLAGAANNDVISFLVPPNVCIAQDGAMGCAAGHGLHHPTRIVLATPGNAFPTQLYAATDDGVAWFNFNQSAELVYAGCLDAGATDTCGATALHHGDAIAISADFSSVYVGSSDGAIVGFHRDATGVLTQISCVTESTSPPAGCVTGRGLGRVAGVAVSPDGNSVYTASPTGSAVATFARAANGTITQTGCQAATSAEGCTVDPDLTTVDSIAVSPDSDNVYAGNTQADVATFDRAADGTLFATGCVGGHGAATCANAPVTTATGAISVTPDGAWVDVVAKDANGVSTFARTRPSADIALTTSPSTARVVNGRTIVTRVFTITNHGPAAAGGVQFTGGLPDSINAPATSPAGPCPSQTQYKEPTTVICPLGHLAPGAAVSVTFSVNPDVGTSFGSIAADAQSASFIDDPNGANNTLTTNFDDCPTRNLTTAVCQGSLAAKLVISHAQISPSTFAVEGTHASASRRHHRRHLGAHLRFTLSHHASVSIAIASVRRNRHHHLVVRTRGTLHVSATHATTTLAISGRIHGRALAPGRYHATIRATASGFTAATPRTISFTIVRR